MKGIKILGALALMMSIAGAAWAHHAAAGIDRSETVEVEGVVRQFRWANPHCWIEMEVVNSDGESEIWNFEMLPPTYLVRAGWTRNSIQPGDRVTVTSNGFFDGRPGGLFVSVTLPDGQTLSQRGGRGG